jgi:colanic acid/amylovoran biosynthesis glycosyltransferase
LGKLVKALKMLELLVIQIAWPPQVHPFIERRLRALAKRGIRVTVATSTNGILDGSLLPFAKLVRLPHGGEASMQILARMLFDTFVVLISKPGRVVRLIKQGLKLRGGLKYLLLWWARSIPLLKLSPQIIHFEWNDSAIDYEWLPNLLNSRAVVSCRGRQVNIVPYLPGCEAYAAQLAQSFRRVQAVHCVSQQILEQACQVGLEREKGVVVYTAVDTEFFRPRDVKPVISDSKIRLITVGGAMWRKGYEYLLLAVAHLHQAGYPVQLDIVDENGPERDRIAFTTRDLGIEDHVKMLGKLSSEGVRSALWEGDIFVLPSLSEGLSNAVVEAMSCGLPVVTTDCGGMREAVTNGVEGFVVPTRDPVTMADAIALLIQRPELRPKMGKAGRAKVLKTFTLDRQADEFLALYQRVLSNQ